MAHHTTSQQTAGRPRMYELDLLRLAAALAVVAVHYMSSGHYRGFTELSFPELAPVARYGYLGVDLFFLISGLVVFQSAWGRSPRSFLTGRAVRLFPAFWLAVTVTAACIWTTGAVGRAPVTIPEYAANLTMVLPPLAGIPWVESVYWTLWFEWRFYLLLWVFVMVGITRRRAEVFCWSWLAVALAADHLPLGGPGARIADAVAMPKAAHYFIAGMGLFLARRFGYSRSIAALIGVSYLQALLAGVDNARTISSADGVALHPAVVAAAVTGIFALMVAVASGWTARLGRPSFAPWGALTYPLYLIHATLGFALFNALHPAVNRWVLLVGVTGLMLAASWLVSARFEPWVQPRLRARLERRPAHTSPRAPEAVPFEPTASAAAAGTGSGFHNGGPGRG
jgi:peptidoglycan/LPS O-acetylase OafA/YrhL